MKTLLKTLLVIVTIFTLKFIYTFGINTILINDYKNDIYNISTANMLYFLNINENYIAHYNNGNILYKNKKYNEAIDAYNKALNSNPKKDRICSIRINLALASLEIIDKKNSSYVLNELNKIQEILYEDNCAIKGVEIGNDEKADEIDDEIEKIKDELKEEPEEEEEEENGNEEEEENENPSSGNEYQEIEEQIREQQREAQSSRNESMEYYENGYGTDYYNGKRW